VKPLNILLVDDDAVDVETVKRAFRRRGVSNPVVVARDGVEALKILLGTDERPPLSAPRLILLDLNMPRMDGFEFLRELRHYPQYDDDPVFILTTSDDDAHRAEAHRLGMSGYIVKGDLPALALDLIMRGLENVPPAELVTVDVGEIARGVVRDLDPEGHFDLVLPPAVLLLETAGVRLECVLRCLFQNAIDHHDHDHGRLALTWDELDEMVRFRVQDDGPGIAPGRAREIFRPLVSTKPEPAGSPRVGQGMGLPLARHIVGDAGGTIQTQGSISRGTTFTFTWPITWSNPAEVSDLAIAPLDTESVEIEGTQEPDRAPQNAPQNAPQMAAGGGPRTVQPTGFSLESQTIEGLHVLAVDADMIDRASLGRAMVRRGLGAWWHEADSITRALALLRGADGIEPLRPGLIFLSPGWSGRGDMDFIDAVRANPELVGVSVFILSDAVNAADRRRAARWHVAGFIDKGRVAPSYDAVVDLVVAYTAVVAP